MSQKMMNMIMELRNDLALAQAEGRDLRARIDVLYYDVDQIREELQALKEQSILRGRKPPKRKSADHGTDDRQHTSGDTS